MTASDALRASGSSRLYALDPAMPILLRPDDAVQVGWDPRRAVLVRPPQGLTAAALAALLRCLQSPTEIADLHREGLRRGLQDGRDLDELIDQLVAAGVVVARPRRRRGRSVSIRVHGRGPLSDLLVDALRCSGARIKHSSHANAAVSETGADLVVLSDFLVADPRMVRDLHDAGVPHLPVRVRDGAGLVGPLVIPGVTSCLGCADLHRSDRDAAWPAVAAQLRDVVGNADRATVLATAALALGQVDHILRGVRGAADAGPTPEPPATLNTTLEFDVNTHVIVARRWSRHPRCGC
jgi:hypothetical protein